MDTNTLVGLILIGMGFLDSAVVAFLVVPKIADPQQKLIVGGTVITVGLATIIVGSLLVSGTLNFFGN
jgi:hypothetical protein